MKRDERLKSVSAYLQKLALDPIGTEAQSVLLWQGGDDGDKYNKTNGGACKNYDRDCIKSYNGGDCHNQGLFCSNSFTGGDCSGRVPAPTVDTTCGA